MKTDTARVAALIATIREAEEELRALTGGQLANLLDDDGRAKTELLKSESVLRQLTDELAAERARLLSSQRVAAVGGWETDAQTLEVVWSDQTFRIFELDAASFRPTHEGFLERVHPEDRARVDDAFRSSLNTPGTHAIEHRLVCEDGRVKIVEERWETQFSPSGQPRLVVGTCQDITARVLSEKALHESQILLRIAGRAARLGGWMLELPELKLSWSDEVCELHDLPLGHQPSLQEALDAYAEEHQEELRRAVNRCMEEGAPFDLELVLVTAKGRRIWVRALGEAVRDPAGKIVRIQGGIQDITARKEATSELDRTNRALKMLSGCNEALIRASHEGHLLHEICRIVVEVGGYRMAWVGYPTDDEGRSVAHMAFVGTDEGNLRQQRISWSDERPEGLGPAGRTLREGRVNVCRDLQADPTFLWKDEARVRGYRSMVCLPLREGARTFGLLALYGSEVNATNAGELELLQELADNVSYGITSLRVRAEGERVGRQVAQQAALLDQATDAIFVLDLDRRVTFWSRGAERLYGVSSAQALGQPLERLIARVESSSVETVDESMQAVMTGGAWSGEVRKRTGTGELMVAEARWTLVRGELDRPAAILAIESDVTERRRLENQFLRAQRMDSLGTLAGGIAHDLNNVLTPILMSVDVLKGLATAPGDKEMVAMLRRCAQRGTDLVKQVLTFAQGADGQRVPVHLGAVLKEIEGIVRDTFPKNISFESRGTPDAWPVLGDATRLHQILMNLCVNARDAMPRGGRLNLSIDNLQVDELYSRMHQDAQVGPYVVVTVSDTGEGIAPELQELIFDPFFTTKAPGKGSGLGLSTSMAILRSYGGFITLASEPLRGATFKVHLPASPAGAQAEAPVAEPSGPLSGNGQFVLVVDDEEAIRLVAQRALEGAGYHVKLAKNGAEAVAVFARNRAEIAVVLTDMDMPVMDGTALLAALRTMDPTVPVIGSSGLGTAEAKRAGMPHFLAKPYPLEALLEVMHKALRSRRPTTAPTSS